MKTIKIADIMTNDVVNGQGICTSVWLQGCPHHCPGCHNPEAWDFNGGTEYEQDMITFEVLKAMRKNGIQRNQQSTRKVYKRKKYSYRKE